MGNSAALHVEAEKRGDRLCYLLRDATIYWDGDASVVLVAASDVTARVETGGSSHALLIATDNSRVVIRAGARSLPTIRGERDAHLTVVTTGASCARVLLSGRATAAVTARGRSRPSLEAVDSSRFTLVVEDQAQPRCADWPEDWNARTSDVYIGQRVMTFASEEEAVAAARAVHREWLRCRNRYAACARIPGSVPRVCQNVVDFRWTHGTVHMELPCDSNPHAWLSRDAHDLHPLTEAARASCRKHPLEPASRDTAP